MFAAVVPIGSASADEGKLWLAGFYSFSDELGGFTITGVTGTGAKDDPIVITEELNSASPVTLVIRATQILKPFAFGGDSLSGFTHFRFVVLNNTGLAWVEFEFELQELKDQPSVFGDGLSFDQRQSETGNISFRQFRQIQPRLRALRPVALSRGQGRPARKRGVRIPGDRLHPALAVLYRPGSAHPLVVIFRKTARRARFHKG